MVERTLSMREAVGSMPTFSNKESQKYYRISVNAEGEKFDKVFFM